MVTLHIYWTNFVALSKEHFQVSVGPKAYTTRGGSTILKKEYKITNSELDTKMNIYLE